MATATPIFIASIDTKTVTDLLRECPIRGMITYSQIQERIGRNPQAAARGCVMTARRILEKEGIVFGVIKNIGLLRLDDSGVVKTAESDVCSIRRKAHRGFNRVSRGVINYPALKIEDKMKFNASASILGMLSAALTPLRLKRIEERVKGESGALPLAKTLEVFRD